MEYEVDVEKSTKKIYKERAIDVATFLGGPLVAGYLIAENFKVFNETDKVKKTWFYVVIVTVLIIGSIFFIPDSKVLNLAIPAIYVAFVHYFVQRFQKQYISAHIMSGGQLFGWWRTIFVGLTGGVITLLFIAIIAFLAGDLTDKNMDFTSKAYGKLHHEIYYDKTNISENEIDQIAYGLTETTYFDNEYPKSVFVAKKDSDYEITFSVFEDAINDNETLPLYIHLKNDLQNYFPNNKIVINLTPDHDVNNVIKRIE